MAWVNAIIQGILTGGRYALFACGLSLLFGVMKVVNLAHGDLATVAGYIGIGVGDSFITASFSIGSQITIAWLNVLIFVLAVVVLLGLQYFLSGSWYGRLIRAVADDREAAQLSGADYRHVFGIAAAIAFGTVALAGIAEGMVTTLSPTIGTDTILLFAFASVVIGGLASMWNLLAGYAGLVSVGQQAFLGLGAYFVLIPATHGVTPWAGLVIATAGAAVCALPLWWLVARLRLSYFAIATWVLASVVMLVIEQIQSIGGGTGEALPGLTGMDPAVLTAYTYWAALTVAVLATGGVYVLLRSRVGLALTAIRDDERAARSSGVRVGLARMGVFAAAAGCGAAGGVLAIEQLQVVPGTSGGVFSVQWTAEMAFAVIIGGIGTIEGPILGTIVYLVLQQTLQSYNAWYLIILGIVAIVIAIFARRGLWGTLDARFNLRLFPVGYHLWSPGAGRRRRKIAAGYPLVLGIAVANLSRECVGLGQD